MEVKKRKKYFSPYKVTNDRHVTIMWDYTPITNVNAKGETVESPLALWQEHTFDHIPTLMEIKSVVTDFYNKKIDEKILCGFEWNGKKVWLSSENQFNYKVAYDLAVQTNGKSLPVIFKFGDNENVSYHEFGTLDDITDFYMSSVKYVQTVLQEGWEKKDSINYDVFKLS